MSTLTTAPVAPLLERLFIDSERTKRDLIQEMGLLSVGERRRLMDDMDPLALYARARNAHLAISKQTGTLLYLLARSRAVRTAVEFGTSFGVSTLHLAAALRDNGGGCVITSEFEPGKVRRAREIFERAGLADLVEIREGDGRDTLARDLPETIDLVFLDGAKPLYPHIHSLVEPRMRPGSLIVADNASGSPDYLGRVRESAAYLSLNFGSDVEVSMKVM